MVLPITANMADGTCYRQEIIGHALIWMPTIFLCVTGVFCTLKEEFCMNQLTLRWQLLKRELTFYLFIVFIASLMGLISFCLLHALHLATTIRSANPYLLYFLPIIGVFTAFIYQKYGRGSDRGNNLIIESTYSKIEVPLRMSFFTFFFTILTHLFGGSAGREGSAVQIGGVLSNTVANRFQFMGERKKQMIHSGISAGFASIFGTPLAGAFFGMEMVYLGRFERMSLFPCLLASYVSNTVTLSLGMTHEVRLIQQLPPFSFKLFVIVCGASVLFGIFGRLFAFFIHFLKRIYKQYFPNILVRALVASLIVVFTISLFNGQKYEGLSLQLLSEAFSGESTFYDPLLKLFYTGLTLGAGFQGGEVTPLFAIGASLGSAIGSLIQISPSFLAALGMIAVFGAAANTPITVIMLGIDLFGSQAIPYYVLTALISYTVSGHRGIYGSQVIIRSKLFSLKENEGKKIAELQG